MESHARDLAVERGLDLVVYTGMYLFLLVLLSVFLQTCFVLRYTRGAATAPSERGLGRHLPLQQEPASSPLVSFAILNILNTHNCYVGINSSKSKPVVSLQVLLEDPL